MERLFLRKGDVASSFPVSSWQSVMFSEFEAQMSSEARPFPCVFGVTGHRQDQLRYLFLDPYDVAVLGEQLAQYVSEARSFGPNTSLIVFTRPRPESRPRKFEQVDKWNFCLTTAIIAVNRRDHEQTTAPEPHSGLQ
ncbi:YqcI/YcgG family protein, partial [Bradyrhizobium elkanii]|uniref:YqcI/YcgG family protein n=1 Tax=Bradyrhizobium elkanii TaxID=29448 RepID=UPI000B1CC3B9